MRQQRLVHARQAPLVRAVPPADVHIAREVGIGRHERDPAHGRRGAHAEDLALPRHHGTDGAVDGTGPDDVEVSRIGGDEGERCAIARPDRTGGNGWARHHHSLAVIAPGEPSRPAAG